MACKFCELSGQIGLNWALWLDQTANTILLGSPEETISARTALARQSGRKWAKIACKVLTLVFAAKGEDHCSRAIDNSVQSSAKEIWNWNVGGPLIDDKVTVEPIVEPDA